MTLAREVFLEALVLTVYPLDRLMMSCFKNNKKRIRLPGWKKTWILHS